MKILLAVIQPPKLSPLREALAKVGVERMTVLDAQGFGRQRGQSAVYRGNEYTTYLLRKVYLEIVVNDDFLDRALQTIEQVARTGPEGSIGDGKVFVLPCERTIRIGETTTGPEAV